MSAAGWSLLLGGTLGLGLWLLVSRVPMLRRPALLHRVAPFVLDVSDGARDLVARRRTDPGALIGVVMSPAGDRLAPLVHAVLGSPAAVARRLRQADSSESVATFRGRQLTWAVVGALGGCAVGVLGVLRGGAVAVPLVLALLGAAIGATTVDWLLQQRAKRRLARIDSELPSILEFLSLSLAAGEGLADALRRIATTSSGQLASEFGRVVADGHPVRRSRMRCSG